MSNKGMLTQRYNYKKVVDNSITNDTSVDKSNYLGYNGNKTTKPNWYVSCHNKPKATDRNKISYTNATRARCRRVGNIWIEPESNSWRLSEIEIEQQKLYNKLKREWLKEQSQNVKDINERIRKAAEDTTAKTFNKHTLTGAFAYHQHSSIVRMATA